MAKKQGKSFLIGGLPIFHLIHETEAPPHLKIKPVLYSGRRPCLYAPILICLRGSRSWIQPVESPATIGADFMRFLARMAT
jgi:hypothetical protein